ncbi:MAG: bifunctional hydroxymethylpyrimidine kinase/phosphomethylpyrimidine kinase [Prevotella sp.]|nr:bifunctional hydroxymethylpyrimidine kinase/phosphomethylpyrimidine kinase [Prevotella sp.]
MTRHYVPVLTIAGSDSSGGAGIEADIKTISALGGYAEAVITAVTAQNTIGVTAISAVPAEVVGAQIDAVMADIMPQSVKIGMTGTPESTVAIATHLRAFEAVPVVLDPVMVSTSGSRLTDDEAVSLMVEHLVPMATLLTPNVPEAERLVGHGVETEPERTEAARKMLLMGCRAVLLKGGHGPEGDTMTDRLYWFDDRGALCQRSFDHPRVATSNTHGTGCTLSSAIATHLAMGLPLVEAVEKGIHYLCQALIAGADIHVGKGHGPVNHLFNPMQMTIKPD